jgi:error-prone DNA polymerase
MSLYAELQITTNFSFLRGASHPEEFFVQARALGLSAVGVTDRNSLAGIVRAHEAAERTGVRLVVGCRLDLEEGVSFSSTPPILRPTAACAGCFRSASSAPARAPAG